MRAITRSMGGELVCEYFTAPRIHGQMELAPLSPIRFVPGLVPAVDPESRAINQKMNLTTASAQPDWGGVELFGTPRKGGVIRNSDTEFQKCTNRL